MVRGEFLTRSSIWLSIAAYTLGSLALASQKRISRADTITRLAWTIGCAALLLHYVFAFHFYHNWSHTLAYGETARQTAEVYAINWGGGLFINYALLILWIGDISWWWMGGNDSYRKRRPWLLVMLWHAFLIFIIFNGTVVFTEGITRWLGLTLTLILILSWIVITRQHSRVVK